ncbi:hypothetical protein Tco_1121635 [Tanacetum coccineum]|uniref:Uncharacterized protein n=1 Tax=Tanacetum coccineum TaxID=301880 RepID=A0ABQ5IY98_9ASTR
MSTPNAESLPSQSFKLSNGIITSIWIGSLFVEMMTSCIHSKKAIFKQATIQDIEDILLFLVQGKLTNLTVEERQAFNVSLRIGFIYQNKDKKNRLMHIDELHKFSDGTLNDVRTALNDRLKGIRIEYLPQTIWRQSNKDKAGSMIQAIDKQLKTRRIMRSLEKFVGGRPYEGDLRLL